MSSEQHGSFIPKEDTVPTRSWEKPISNILIMIAVVIFVFSLSLWGAAFGYHNYLVTRINQACPADDPESTACGLVAELDNVRADLPLDQINRIRDVDIKLRTASTLLARRRSAWPVLALLNDQALNSIQLTGFNLQDQTVKLSGVGRDYFDVAAQSAIWQASDDIRQVTFEEVSRGAGRETVDFQTSLEFASNLLSPAN